MTFPLLCGRVCNEHSVLPFYLPPLSLMSLHLPLVARMLMLSLQQGLPVRISLSLTHPCYLQPVSWFPSADFICVLGIAKLLSENAFFFYGWNVFSMIPVWTSAQQAPGCWTVPSWLNLMCRCPLMFYSFKLLSWIKCPESYDWITPIASRLICILFLKVFPVD